jgi:hypothetical protein
MFESPNGIDFVAHGCVNQLQVAASRGGRTGCFWPTAHPYAHFLYFGIRRYQTFRAQLPNITSPTYTPEEAERS